MFRPLCSAGVVGTALVLVLAAFEVSAQEASSQSKRHEPEIWPGEQCPSSVLDLDRLVFLLGSDESADRWAAAECLGQMKDPRAVEPLVRRILKGDIPRLAMIEAYALRDINDPRAGELLIQALKEKKTRFPAADALVRLQDNRAVMPLIALLRSSDKDDRITAVDTLGYFKDERATAPLAAALKDRDKVVRRGAATALGALGDTHAVDSLCAALGDPDDGVRWNASVSLGDLKDRRAVEPLSAALSDDEENVRKAAADALGKIRDPRAVPALIAAFKSGNRWHSAEALTNIKDSQAADFLSASLKQPQIDVVAAAHIFFIRQGDPASIEPLIEALNKYGRWEMAQDYMFCRNLKLEDAARQWASKHDETLSPPDGPVLTWGSDK